MAQRRYVVAAGHALICFAAAQAIEALIDTFYETLDTGDALLDGLHVALEGIELGFELFDVLFVLPDGLLLGCETVGLGGVEIARFEGRGLFGKSRYGDKKCEIAFHSVSLWDEFELDASVFGPALFGVLGADGIALTVANNCEATCLHTASYEGVFDAFCTLES